MLQVAIRHVRPEKETKLRMWLAELNARADEVRDTFRSETVRAEQAFIVPGVPGPILIYIMEAEDFARGSKAFAESSYAIDAEHREVMRECLGESLELRPLYDVALEARGSRARSG
jgi:hypothetical protein